MDYCTTWKWMHYYYFLTLGKKILLESLKINTGFPSNTSHMPKQ